LPKSSVNQRLPSEPVVMSKTPPWAIEGIEALEIPCASLIKRLEAARYVNQRALIR
jgi:hypothetical protein